MIVRHGHALTLRPSAPSSPGDPHHCRSLPILKPLRARRGGPFPRKWPVTVKNDPSSFKSTSRTWSFPGYSGFRRRHDAHRRNPDESVRSVCLNFRQASARPSMVSGRHFPGVVQVDAGFGSQSQGYDDQRDGSFKNNLRRRYRSTSARSAIDVAQAG